MQALARAMTFGWAKRHPLFATSVGLTERDGDLDSPSAAANAADLAQIRSWERALGAIPAGSALVDRDDARLLRAQLVSMERVYTEYRPYEKDYSAPAQAIVSTLFTQFVHLPTGDTEAENAERSTAWRKSVERMQKAPAYIRTGQGLV
ncbi:MAG: hypothetical protein GIW95_07010, partial [Candidatus Eremiobacteraeota bacterium]|nr:hypothetical protein [Candidatus Eremiobacteraeota bacterium]